MDNDVVYRVHFNPSGKLVIVRFFVVSEIYSGVKIEQRAPFGWTVEEMAPDYDLGLKSEDGRRQIPICGEDVLREPFAHQPEWGCTPGEALARLTKQLRVRLALTQDEKNQRALDDIT